MVLAFVVTAILAPLCAGATISALVAPYPPADWSAASFTGTVVDVPRPTKKKAAWAIVHTDDGATVTMPRDVHNGLPMVGWRVRKQPGRVEFEAATPTDPPGTWTAGFAPADEPGANLPLGVLICTGWSLGLLLLFFALATWRRRRTTLARLPG